MDHSRIEDLKRRIQKDPASIVFAQLGEEYRRAGRCREAIETCRTGLRRHPGYLSARVTLGRALFDLGNFEQAERELKEVLRLAPENLAALRGVAEALQRRGDRAGALAHYEMALALAPRDADLQQVVATLREELEHSASTKPRSSEVGPLETTSQSGEVRLPPEPPQLQNTTPAAAVQIVQPDLPCATEQLPDPVLPVLERWLDLIVADRQQRANAVASRQ